MARMVRMDEIDSNQQKEIEKLQIMDKAHDRELMFLRMLMFIVFMLGVLMVGITFFALDSVQKINKNQQGIVSNEK